MSIRSHLKNKWISHWPVFLALVGLTIVSWNFLLSGWHSSVTADWDWDQYWGTREIVRRIWMKGGALFPWVAHFCGGFPMLDSTEIPYHSPTVLFYQWFGTVPGSKFEFVFLLGLGLIGMYRAIGELIPKSPNWVRACAALHFVICGFLLFHLNAGHFSFSEFALFSWIVYGFLSGRAGPIALALAAGVNLGSNNYFMHAVLFTLALGVTCLAWMKLAVRSGLWAGLLSAPLLVYNLIEYPHAKYLKFTAANHHELPQTIDNLIRFMITPSTNLWACDVDCYWEYGDYIGIVALVIGVVGILRGSFFQKKGKERNQFRSLGIAGIIFLLIAMGPFSEIAPFRLFLHFPLLRRLEVNTRFLLGVTVVLFMGWAWVLGSELQKTSRKRILAIILACASIGPSLIYARSMFNQPVYGDNDRRGRLLPDLRDREADMIRMETVPDFRIGRYEAVANQVGINICHISSSKGTYPGKVQIGKGALIESPSGSSARWDDRFWFVEWDPSVSAKSALSSSGTQLSWLLNQNYNENFVVDRLNASPKEKLGSSNLELWTKDGLLGFEIKGHPSLSGKQNFRLRLKTPKPVLFAYGISLIGWVIFLFSFISRKVLI